MSAENETTTPSQSDCETLSDRMKAYEKDKDSKILPYLPFIVRLDGNNFSKFTKGFNKPFDENFVNAMINTMNDLVEKFSAKTGYTHSDEITLIFSSACTKDDFLAGKKESIHVFNGRIQKLCSLFASFCSVRFNYHIVKSVGLEEKKYKPSLVEKVKSYTAHFDSRIIVFPEQKDYEIVNHMIWRSVHDCHRNAVATYAQHYFSSKELNGKEGPDMIKMLKEKYSVDWDDVPENIKYGVYGKKELYEKITDTPAGPVKAMRRRIINKTLKIEFSDAVYNMLMDKYWNDIKVEITMNMYKGKNA